MFVCDLCARHTKPGEKMLKVPDRVTHSGFLQIVREAKLCPPCAKRYVEELAELAPGINPQSARAALIE